MVVCWRYAEARAFEPFEDEALPEGKEPNELRIGLFQATGLAVKDKALLWGEGSSDPRMTFSVPEPLSSARPRRSRSLSIPRGSR